jgi:hypothetical protein
MQRFSFEGRWRVATLASRGGEAGGAVVCYAEVFEDSSRKAYRR